ncbi:MAG: sodium:solute symporter family protein [Thermoguttaceae bacterium]|nr:sodium:solute symporter family protein [Thermoguttaceae bacterium]
MFALFADAALPAVDTTAAASSGHMSSLIVVGLFFLALLVIAAWGMTKTKNVDDFFLAGRSLGPWILAISYGAAYFSAVVFIGFAGTYGWQCSFKSLWVGVGNAVLGGLLAWLVLGKRTRKMTRRLGASTMPEFFLARYGSNFMKFAGALAIFVFLLPYSAGVFAGLTYLFKETINVDGKTMLTIITAITGVYLVVGGYKAAARIDFLQGAIMFVGAIAMVFFVWKFFAADNGGYIGAVEKASALFKERSANPTAPVLEGGLGGKPVPGWLFWSVVFMSSASTWGMPQMVQKYYAIKDEKQIVKGSIVCFAFAMIVGVAAYSIGAFSHLLPLDQIQGLLNDKGVPDVNQLVPVVLIKSMPSWLLAIVLILVLSASMSTLCSLTLASASALSVDFFKGYVAKNAKEKTYLLVFRLSCAFFVVGSYLIALFQPSWIVALTALTWGVVAGGFIAPYVYGLFWKGTTKAGAIAGMITGFLVSNGLYWYLFFGVNPGTAKMYSPVVASLAMVVPFAVVPIVSAISPKLSEERVKKAFEDAPEA